MPDLSPFRSVGKVFGFGAWKAQKTTHKNKLVYGGAITCS